jgi:UDPglucose 6-dehydrogenase
MGCEDFPGPVIGIVGGGFVGAAHYVALRNRGYHNVIIYDIEPNFGRRFPGWNLPLSVPSLNHLVERADIVLVCVPTPPLAYCEDGRCEKANLSIVKDVLNKLNILHAIEANGRLPVCIKSTVPPGTTSKFATQFRGLHLHFSPEFLTEADPVGTLMDATRVVIGSDEAHDTRLVDVLRRINTNPHVCNFDDRLILCINTAAELIKYGSNVTLFTKLMLFNFYYDIAGMLGCNYDVVRRGIALDDRIGPSHTYVPGPDGLRGAGGSCFMKDIGALEACCQELGLDPAILQVVQALNTFYRPEQDWVKNRYRNENKAD